VRGVRFLEPSRTFRDQFLETLASQDNNDTSAPSDALAIMAGQPQQQLFRAISEVRSILSGPSIQARCLECPEIAPARVEKKDLSLLETLVAWLK